MIRKATTSERDAGAMARLIAFAGEGLPQLVWSGMTEPGEDVWAVGRRRARREEGSFSYRNTVLYEIDGTVRACLIGYPLEAEPEAREPEDIPPLFHPLQELEDLAPGTWYVNVLATFEGHRGQGLGEALLAHAESSARQAGLPALSIIVRDENRVPGLYARTGYAETARREIVRTDGWDCDGRDWVLMVKAL